MTGHEKRAKQRIDDLLVARGLAETIELARALIMAGKVIVADQRVDKPATLIGHDLAVRVRGDDARFVSRAGDKLAHALEDLNLASSLKDQVVLDIGASTGGFTQCCLGLGAKLVIALDVGTAQLAWELRQDPRVVSIERTDIRAFNPNGQLPIDWVVADVSFNSLARLAPAIRRAAPRAGVKFLLLIKPQFELPRRDIPNGGVVDDDALRQKAVDSVSKAMAAVGLETTQVIAARLPGKAGNREVFIYSESKEAFGE